MKKLLVLFVAVLALTGCASRHVGPAIVGGVVGYSIANSQPRTVVVHQAPVVVQEHIVIVNEQCNQYMNSTERLACERVLLEADRGALRGLALPVVVEVLATVEFTCRKPVPSAPALIMTG